MPASIQPEAPRPAREPERRALVERLLSWLKDRVPYADLCLEEVVKLEYHRLASGEEILKPYTAKGALQLRLVGEAGRKLELSVGLLPFEQLQPSLERALAALALQEPNPAFGLAAVPPVPHAHFGLPAPLDLREADAGPALAALTAAVDALAGEALAGRPDLELKTELWAYHQVEDKIVADTDGLYRTQVLPSTFAQLTATCRDRRTGRATEQRGRLGEIAGPDWLVDPVAGLRPAHRKTLGDTLARAVALQGGRRLTGDELAALTHVVLDSTAMVFVHEAQGHNFEADLVRDGASGLVHADGRPAREPLGPPQVDLWDGQVLQPDGSFSAATGFGTHFIDDEGVPVRPVRLVHRGRISGLLHSRETAHHFGTAPNGHGFSELGDPRLPRMTNTYLHPAEGAPWFPDVASLVEGVPFGVFLMGSKGGAVSKDGMSTTVQFGRVIRDGRLTDEVLLPCNLTVRTVTALEGVEAFAGPLRCDDPGFCGKGQIKTVTDGGPLTRIRVTDAITLGW